MVVVVGGDLAGDWSAGNAYGGPPGVTTSTRGRRVIGPLVVPPAKRPTLEDRHNTARAALAGIAAGTNPVDLTRQLEALHPERDTFPAKVFLDLAADALDTSGASRDHPVGYSGIRARYLSEISFRGKTQHHRSHYALRAVAMITAGVDPDLLDEVSWWYSDHAVMTESGDRPSTASRTAGPATESAKGHAGGRVRGRRIRARLPRR